MLQQLQRHNLEVIYCLGEQELIADTLSRLPAGSAEAEVLGNYEVFKLVTKELNVIEEHILFEYQINRWKK